MRAKLRRIETLYAIMSMDWIGPWALSANLSEPSSPVSQIPTDHNHGPEPVEDVGGQQEELSEVLPVGCREQHCESFRCVHIQ